MIEINNPWDTILFSPSVSYHTGILHRALYCSADDEWPQQWKPKWALPETTRMPHSPKRFITVIKLLLSRILAHKSRFIIIPDFQHKSAGLLLAGEVGGRSVFSFSFFFFLFLSRWTSPSWIINSSRLLSEKQIASFKHENDCAKGWQTQQSAFITAVRTRHKSHSLDPLEKLLCYTYNLLLTCCIYWETNLSDGSRHRFNTSVIAAQ